MDKIKKYQTLIIDFLKEYSKYSFVNAPEIELQVICDNETNHFQLTQVGWHGHKFVHNAIFHFDIKTNGKIWIQKTKQICLLPTI